MFALRFIGEFRGLGDQASVGETMKRTFARMTPPREARDWLIPWVLLTGIVGSIDCRWRRPILGALVWGLLAIAAFWLMLRGSVYFQSEWTVLEAACWMACLGVNGMLLSWMLTNRDEDGSRGGMSLSWGLTVAWVCTSLLLMTSGSQTFGMLGLSAAAGAGHAAVVTSMKRRREEFFAGGFWGFVLVLLIGLGLFFAEVTVWRGLGVVAGLAIFGASHRWRWRGSRWVGWLVLFAALGWVIGGSIIEFQEKMREQDADPYRSAYGGP
jgi:hypothetical protein